MIIFKIASDLDLWLSSNKAMGKIIGFVPTMGALHEGHISLIGESNQHTDLTVSSIFINPTQFNNAADFQKYPVSLEHDIYLLERVGCDAVLIPGIEEVYPEGIGAGKHYNLGYLESILEGKSRPGHFQGVCRVVHKLLDIVDPHKLFLGQKDFQQCLVIKKLLSIIDSATVLKLCPTKRETDGLAMSSRNRRLSSVQREKAPAIFKSLAFVKQNIKHNDLEYLKSRASELMISAGLVVDYIEVANATDLTLVHKLENNQTYIALAAAYVDEIRLIDNILLE